MAVPVIESSYTVGETNATSKTLTKPSGTVQGDLLVAFLSTARAGGAVGTVTPPSGWNLIAREDDTSSNNVSAHGYWKVAGASEGADYTWDWNASGNYYTSGGIYRISGADTAAPIAEYTTRTRQTGTGANETGSTVNAPAITTTLNDNLLLVSMSTWAANISAATATGWTAVGTGQTYYRSLYKNQTTAGTSSSVSTGISEPSDGHVEVAVAIKPAPTVRALDDFNRANGALSGGSWAMNMDGWPSISSNVVTPGGFTNDRGAYWNSTDIANDQWSEADIVLTGATGGGAVLWVRRTATNATYAADWTVNGTISLVEVTPGSGWTQIGSSTGNGTSGKLRIEAIGTQITVYKDGVEVISVSNSTHTTGKTGFHIYYTSGTQPTLDNFRAGDWVARTPPTLTAYSQSTLDATYGNGAAITVGSSFSWAAGDVVVVTGGTEAEHISITIDNETNLTFTAVSAALVGVNECWGRAWTAVASGSGTGTISGTVAHAGSSYAAQLSAWHFTNTDGVGNNVGAVGTGTTPTQTMQAVTNSAVVTAWYDYTAAAGPWTGETNTGTLTERLDNQVATRFSMWAGDWNGVTAGSDAWGTTSGAGLALTFAGTIEVLGKTDTGSSPQTWTGSGAAVQVAATSGYFTINQMWPAPVTRATDNFNRANGGLGSNWTTVTGEDPMTIVSNAAQASTGGYLTNASVYTGSSFAADQFAEIQVVDAGSLCATFLFVRMSTSTLSGYGMYLFPNTSVLRITKWDSGTETTLTSKTLGTATGTWKLEAVGTSLKLYRNGALELSTTDSTHASGYPGLGVEQGSASSQLDNFTAGDWASEAATVQIAGTSGQFNPLVPKNLVATTFNDDRIDLTWDAVAGASGYDVQRTVGGAPLVVTDDFNRANGGLGSNWTAIGTAPEIVSNKTQATNIAASCRAAWTTAIGDGATSIWVECDVVVSTNTTYNGPLLSEANNSKAESYGVVLSNDGTQLYLTRTTGGVDLDIATVTNMTIVEGNTYRVRLEWFVGGDIRVYVDGVERIAINNTAVTPSYAGIQHYTGTGTLGTIDNFRAGVMPPAEVRVVPLASGAQISGNFTTPSITPGANCMLVLCVGAQNWDGTDPTSILSSGSGPDTWVEGPRNNPPVGAVGTGIFYAEIGASDPGSFTITFTWPSSVSSEGWVLFKVTNYNTATPIGGTDENSEGFYTYDGAKTAVLSAAPSVNDATIAFTYGDTASIGTGMTFGTTYGSWFEVDVVPAGQWGSGGAGWRTGSTSANVEWTDVLAGASSDSSGGGNVAMVIKALPQQTTTVIATDVATNAYSDTGLDPSTTYEYQVRSVF